MTWWRINNIPIDKENFNRIIMGFVFECPSSIKKNDCFFPISDRRCSFRQNGIEKSLLNTIFSQIRKHIGKSKLFPIEKADDFDRIFNNTINGLSFQDPLFEVLFYRKRSDMSDTEAIYYYIRNAFAHGAFECVKYGNCELIYLLESGKNNRINARIRLKEQTLLKLLEIKEMSSREIKNMQKKNIKKKS